VVKVPRNRVPVFQREGSLVAFNVNDNFDLFSDVGNDTENCQNILLRVFPGDGCSLSLIKDQGEAIQTISVTPVSGKPGWQVELPGFELPVEIDFFSEKPDEVICDGTPVEWRWDAAVHTVVIRLVAAHNKQTIQIH
jgi:alpha-glucosidase (family GH31 glycosyl hydrolase)